MSESRGRDAGCPAPPAQIPAGGFPAPGSSNQLGGCLASIVDARRDGFSLLRVVVVDNASIDKSLDCIESFALPLLLIRNTENRGFAAGCNQGAVGSAANFLLFLNPDTRLFANSLTVPTKFMAANERVGICGVQLVDENKRVARSCATFPTPRTLLTTTLGLDKLLAGMVRGHYMREWDHASNRRVDQVMGAFFYVRRILFEHLEGFDERFFVYFEDVDFAYRANQQEWQTVYLACAQVYHRGCGTSEQVKARRLYYNLKSRILYGYKHFSWLQATGVLCTTMMLEPVTRIVYALVRMAWKDVVYTVAGFVLLWKELLPLIKASRA